MCKIQMVCKSTPELRGHTGQALWMDTTTNSGTQWKAFAPSKEMVYGIKGSYSQKYADICAGQGIQIIQWEQYAAQYVELMRKQWLTDDGKLFKLAANLAQGRGIALACYCEAEKACNGRCHRSLLAQLIRNVVQKEFRKSIPIVETTIRGEIAFSGVNHPYVIPPYLQRISR